MFNLPNLFGNKLSSASNESTSIDNVSVADQCANDANSNLSEYVTASKAAVSDRINIVRTQSGAAQSPFVIPKFSLGNNSSISPKPVDDLTPHEISLKKIMDLKKMHISHDTQENVEVSPHMAHDANDPSFNVDLTEALTTEPNNRRRRSDKSMETIDYRFVDCEVPTVKMTRALVECEIDIANIMREQLSNRSRKTTAFGKVLCSRFRCTNRPQIEHGFYPKHKIVPFHFDERKRSQIQ